MSDSLRSMLRALPDFPSDLPSFDPAAAPSDPTALFREWLGTAMAAGVRQAHAFSLATADADGTVSNRMMILKEIDGVAWHFATARTSRKGRELTANARAAMNFSWLQLGRQVRLVGPVFELPADASAADWDARPGGDGSPNPAWQLYALRPTEIEFWQASHDRRHVRHFYTVPAEGPAEPLRVP